MKDFTPAQCRAARAYLNQSRAWVGDQAGVGVSTVNKFENGHYVHSKSVSLVKQAFERVGLQFGEDGLIFTTVKTNPRPVGVDHLQKLMDEGKCAAD